MAAPAPQLRETLSAPGLIGAIRTAFAALPDARRAASVKYSLPDALLAAQAMFQFKHASLLQFDTRARDGLDPTVAANLQTLFGIERVPCDTQMRAILDPIDPALLRPAFRAVQSAVQRGGALRDFAVFKPEKSADAKRTNDTLLVSIDGTGQFGSTTVRCAHCCTVSSKKKGIETEYRHQLLTAAIVHPDRAQALPIDFEPIVRTDGARKNDCELCAAKRLIVSLAAQYPNRSMIVNADALYANGPFIRHLKDKGLGFIIVVKPTGNESLFDDFDARRLSDPDSVGELELTDADTGVVRGCRFANGVAINRSRPDVLVNVVEFWEIDAKGVEHNWSWATSLKISEQNAFEIARAGRSRWRIENLVFNTLKNQGYEFGHNYGHGKRFLASVLAGLMLLAFLVDQVQEHACRWFGAAREKSGTKKDLWASMLVMLRSVVLDGWESLWRLIAKQGVSLRIDTQPSTG